MVDRDHDDKVDRVVLTWSEPITHARDADHRYPFSISGYVITSVGSARRSRTLTLLVREHSTRDIAAHPAVHYQPTTTGAVKDNGRRQALRQAFTRTVPLDRDRDGYAAKDCRATLASVHPGAVDRPDTSLLDANCDGIDGLRTGPLFVSPLGQDSNAGTITAPLRTFDQAVADSGGTRDIYLAAGTYPSALTSPLTSSVYGGYSTSWSRSAASSSTLALANPLPVGGSPTLQLVSLDAPTSNTDHGPVAVQADHATARFERVTITSAAAPAGSTGTPARNSVGLWATDSTITLIGGSITAGHGGAGAAGTAGSAGDPGGDGTDGLAGECVLGLGVATGGPGGTSPIPGHLGGPGGLGGTTVVPASPGLSSLDLTPGGSGGSTGTTGGAGQPGTPGADGTAGTPGSLSDGTFGALGYTPGTATDGTSGTTGLGGGGGGGGGAQLNGLQLGTGNGGGGGGGGGAPGTDGTAASGGGGSIGVWADSSTISVTGTRIVTLGGGEGGIGGAGGAGGLGGAGGAGGTACPDRVGVGGHGGHGGTGGAGGAGGDGSGGPSIGVVRLGTSSVTASGVVWQLGPAGESPAGAAHDGPRFTIGTVS